MEKLTNKEYDELVKKNSPNTKSYKTIPMAFLIGGIICVIGQLLIELFKANAIPIDIASMLASLCLVVLSAILTGFNVYDNIAVFGGAGTLVPITGFANAVTAPTLEFKTEGFVLGLGAKMFVLAGPVILYGTLASVLYGVIVFIFGL